MAYESVILVDENDNMTGTMEKMAAHRSARLHRALSIFIFNEKGEMLLQQRACHKYHSAGKWSNACCSHPRPGERTIDAASRRLREELGLQCHLEHVFSFTYHTAMENGLYEHEYDHVFIGTTDSIPNPNPFEVSGIIYLSPDSIESDLAEGPDRYTEWFKICFKTVMDHFKVSEND